MKYRIDYWPHSGDSKIALTSEQIEANFPMKQYFFEVEDDHSASAIVGIPGNWQNSDGVLLVRIEEDGSETKCYRNPFRPKKPNTPREMQLKDL